MVLRARKAAAIVVLACPPDRLRATILDDAGFGERLDEGNLLFGSPAVVARADRHGDEGSCCLSGSWFICFRPHSCPQQLLRAKVLEPYWNIDEGV